MAYIQPVSAYVTEAWERALGPLGIKLVEKDNGSKLKFLYMDYDSYDFERRDEEAEVVYSYVYRKGLTRKNYLGSTIAQFCAKRPNSVLHKSWPQSFNFELDFPEFLDDALDECWELRHEISSGNKTFILKPALGERGDGIHLFKTQEDLQTVFDNMLEEGEEDDMPMRQYVVQEYVENPKLVDGRKFHLRVYVACVGRMEVFVCGDALCLFSDAKYDPENLADMSGHLTNTCVQGEGARVELLSTLFDKSTNEKIKAQIDAVVHDLFLAAYSNPVNFQPLPNAFEFFGLDFLLSEDGGIWLLEVNAYPDFKQTGAQLRHVVDTLFTETAAYVFANTAPKTLRHVLSISDRAGP